MSYLSTLSYSQHYVERVLSMGRMNFSNKKKRKHSLKPSSPTIHALNLFFHLYIISARGFYWIHKGIPLWKGLLRKGGIPIRIPNHQPPQTHHFTGLGSPMWNELLRGSGRSIEISRAPWDWEENCGHIFQWEIPPSGLKNAKMRAFFETKWFCFGWGMLLTNHQTDSLGSTWSGSRTKTLHLYCDGKQHK